MQIKHFIHKIHDFIIGFVSNVLIAYQYSKNLLKKTMYMCA